MKDTELDKIQEWSVVGGGLIPFSDTAIEFLEQCQRGQVIAFKEVTARDISFHRCYMLLLSYIYGYLPRSFQTVVPKEKFYKWLKHLKGQYKVLFEFKDGTKLVEYDSISFGKMPQKAFEDYIREQLPWIYTEVIGKFYEGDIYDGIIKNIEDEFEKFLAKL
jgi:hypothetical protein